MARKFKAFAAATALIVTAVIFQNCRNSFDSTSPALSTLSSSQCKLEVIAQTIASKIPASQLKCADLTAFTCEEQIFSPNVNNLQHTLTQCVNGEQSCVKVNVLQFNTSHAAGAQPSQFEPGGDYNREDIRCYNNFTVNGTVVIQASGSSLADALANAVAACQSAQEGT